MMTFVKSMVVCGVVLVPAVAWAQMSDAAYCSALSDKYQKYTSDNSMQHRGADKNVTADAAMAQCSSKPGDSIPVLEKALKDAKLDLPKR